MQIEKLLFLFSWLFVLDKEIEERNKGKKKQLHIFTVIYHFDLLLFIIKDRLLLLYHIGKNFN